jgi:hypothetical protein
LRWPWKRLEPRDREIIHNLRARSAQISDGSLKECDDAVIGPILKLQSLAEDTDTRALQSVLVEKCRRRLFSCNEKLNQIIPSRTSAAARWFTD